MRGCVLRYVRPRILPDPSGEWFDRGRMPHVATEFDLPMGFASDAMWLRLMNDLSSLDLAGRWDRTGDAEAALARIFGDGVRPLRLEEALFDAVLEGWRRAQSGRHLTEATKRSREAIVRRFCEYVGRWPWEWRRWMWMSGWRISWTAARRAVSTLRGYQGAMRGFMDYLTDERYPWVAICEREFGVRPVQIVEERNSIAQSDRVRGAAGAAAVHARGAGGVLRSLRRAGAGCRARRRKGSLAALRDAALFKTIYAWGLRRQEAARLDVRRLLGATRRCRRSVATGC